MISGPEPTQTSPDIFGGRGASDLFHPLEEVKRYDVGRLKPGTAYAARLPEQRPRDGARIPTLGEVFELVNRIGASHIRFNIETKLTPTSGPDVPDPELFARTVAASVHDAGLTERVSIQSFERCSSCAEWPRTLSAAA